jgi:hypothetical protein
MTFETIFQFTFNNVKYIAQGIVRVKNNSVFVNIGRAGDEFPCIMIEFDKVKRICKVSKLRAQKFGGWKEDDRTICLNPPLPKSGALDILVLLSLAIIRKYIGKVDTYINDGAMVDNQYPLSWKKFWIGKGTTYSKYGFRLREPGQSSEFFKTYMKDIRRKIQTMNVENYIKNMFDKRLVAKYNPKFTDKKLEALDIRGIWYMDWKYYETIYKSQIKLLKFDNV